MKADDPTAHPGPDSVRPSGPEPADEGAPDAVAALPTELAVPARALFGDRLPLAAAYARALATDGVVRGLVGPREAPRMWERHLLNCAALAELIPPHSSVLDVGSGAGLPGLVLAIARPDLAVRLVEPLARRTAFLTEVVEDLGLQSVTVIRARAEEIAAGSVAGSAASPGDIVTARAVAPLDRLTRWCLPLARPGGRLLAMKGASAGDEIAEHRERIIRLGGGAPALRQCAVGLLDPPTTVVEIVRERVIGASSSRTARVTTKARHHGGAGMGSTGGRKGNRS